MAKRKSPGANIDNWQRKTAAVLLRMQPDDEALLRGRAEAVGLSLAAYVGSLVRQDAAQALADDRAEHPTRIGPPRPLQRHEREE